MKRLIALLTAVVAVGGLAGCHFDYYPPDYDHDYHYGGGHHYRRGHHYDRGDYYRGHGYHDRSHYRDDFCW
ncbi:MAG: hypothetical protein ACR2OZ_14250 [Verrucomicrobiales bacterium]